MATKLTLADRAGYALLLSLGLHVAGGAVVGRGYAEGHAAQAASAHSRALEVRLAALPHEPVAVAQAGNVADVEAAVKPPLHAHAMPIGLPAPYYFPASELDQRPRPLAPIELQDPPGDAPDGYLILKLLINEYGTVDDTIVVVNDGGTALATQAEDAFRRARYAPGVKAGRAVKSQMMIEVKLAGTPG